MLNIHCFLGINYWLKDKLLTQTEVGENWVQYWLGAYTEVKNDQQLNPDKCNNRSGTARDRLETGCGPT